MKNKNKTKMSKKKKLIIAIVVVAAVSLLFRAGLMIAAFVTSVSSDTDETTTTSVSDEVTEVTDEGSDEDVTIEFQSPETTEEAETKWVIEPRLCLCFKTEKGFAEQEFTAATVENLAEAKTLQVSNGDVQSVDHEVRLYGVPLGASVSVTCESMVTKAYNLDVGQNDGAYQYYYWKPTLYSASEQGEYTFKLTIRQTEDSSEETILFYKMAV